MLRPKRAGRGPGGQCERAIASLDSFRCGDEGRFDEEARVRGAKVQ